MKQFSFPIIVGISFALVFVGYVVFAVYTGPTQAPPQGNVPAPLNVGPETQTKQGKLIISGGVDSPKVQTPQVCLGPSGGEICKSAWPAELHASDVAGAGAVRNRSWEMGCNARTSRSSCDGWYRKWVFFTELGVLHDWRGIVDQQYTDLIVPDCYEDSSCSRLRTVRTLSSLRCKAPWFTNTNHSIARAVEDACSSYTVTACSGEFACTKE